MPPSSTRHGGACRGVRDRTQLAEECDPLRDLWVLFRCPMGAAGQGWRCRGWCWCRGSRPGRGPGWRRGPGVVASVISTNTVAWWPGCSTGFPGRRRRTGGLENAPAGHAAAVGFCHRGQAAPVPPGGAAVAACQVSELYRCFDGEPAVLAHCFGFVTPIRGVLAGTKIGCGGREAVTTYRMLCRRSPAEREGGARCIAPSRAYGRLPCSPLSRGASPVHDLPSRCGKRRFDNDEPVTAKRVRRRRLPPAAGSRPAAWPAFTRIPPAWPICCAGKPCSILTSTTR